MSCASCTRCRNASSEDEDDHLVSAATQQQFCSMIDAVTNANITLCLELLPCNEATFPLLDDRAVLVDEVG